MAVLVKRDNTYLEATAAELPKETLRSARRRLLSLRSLLAPHDQTLDEVERAIASNLTAGSLGRVRTVHSGSVPLARGLELTP